MATCKKCGFQNLRGTVYCQGCGGKLKYIFSFLRNLDFKYLAGGGLKDSSIAPLAAANIERQAENFGEKKAARVHPVKAVPLPDRTWFCPDCGYHNPVNADFCKSCGRDCQ